MNACNDWREVLMDHALGKAASTALQAHLAACEACSGALSEWSAQSRRLQAGVRRLVTSDPSPHMASRVMAEIRSPRSRPFWIRRWKAAVVLTVGIAVLSGGFFYYRYSTIRRERAEALSAAATLAHWKSPTDSLLVSSTYDWFKDGPRLGKGFYALGTETPASKQREKNP
ncbi:MAG: hypothetical protein PHX83_15705 [Acidobacteriia bacterium]|nr:hypothetical protein [Terriglobia bacterium]